MESNKRSFLGSLRKAIKKIRFLLSFSATRWVLSSIMESRASPPRRRVSFPARPGLLGADNGAGRPSRTVSLGSTTSVSPTSSSASAETWRTSSGAWSPAPGDDDIDRRAEQFIANFYKHIQMERQVSLQLRYCRDGAGTRGPERTLSS